MSQGSFVERIEHEKLGIGWATNKACQTCAFAHGEVMWNGKERELNPDKCFCQIYEPDDSNGKPTDVAFNGAPCEFYAKDDPKWHT